MTTLTGSPVPVVVAPGGYTLLAPALQGTVTELQQSAATTRSETGAYEEPLRRAAGDAGVVPINHGSVQESFRRKVGRTRPGCSNRRFA